MAHRMKKKRHHLLAWSIWFLSALFMFYKYAIEVSPSVMTSQLMSEFGIDGAALGHLAACFFYAYLLMMIPGGLLIDRFGPRKTTTFAIALCACGALLFASVENFWVAQIGRFLSGLGGAFAAVNCLKLTANWFPSNRFAVMAGLMMTLGMLGAVGGQAPLHALIESLEWRGALFTIGIGGLVLSLLFFLVVRDRSSVLAHEASLAPAKADLWKSCMAVFKNKQGWILSVYSGLAFAPVTVFGGLWGVSFLAGTFNLTKLQAAHTVSLLFFGFAAGAPLWGWLSDRMGTRKQVMYLGTALSVIAICAILYLSLSTPVLSIMMFGFGFFISSFLLCFTMIREINAPIVAATAIAFMNTFDALLGALSDPLTGKFLDMGWEGYIVDGARVFSSHDYKIALSIIPIYLIVAFGCLFFIKETHCKSVYPSSMP